jgi:restriction endonuclease S subunit
MVSCAVIKKSQLECANRLDAEYYQPEYFIDFTKGLWRPIGEFAAVCQYGISQAMNDERIGYPIFKMDDIHDTFLFDDNVRYVDINGDIFKGFRLEKNDILFNRVNSEEFVGRTGIFKLNTKAVFASYLIRIRTNSQIFPDYLNIFLNSSFGVKQIRKFRRRAVNQANVNAEELKQIKIAILPIAFQKKIQLLCDESWNSFEQSKALYANAERLLLEELGLNNFRFEEKLSYIANLSDIKSVNRMDAEYFHPKYNNIISKIKARKPDLVDLVSLNDVCNMRRGDFIAPDYYVKKAKRAYIRIKELPLKGDIDLSEMVYVDENFENKNMGFLEEGDFVFAGIGATLGKVARVPVELIGSFYSNNTARFRTRTEWQEKIDSYYLLVVFQSAVCQSQFEQRRAQTAQAKIADEELNTVLIPILPKSRQQKIASLVRKSHEARKKAKELLEQAKKEVERTIEKA